jgi:hypothetical protein
MFTRVFLACFLAATLSAVAGHPSAEVVSKAGPVESEFPFVHGTHEAELNFGGYWGLDTKGTPKRPNMDFVTGGVSYGWMLSDVHGHGFFRGNWEFLVNAFGGAILDGPGDVLAGVSLGMRYNFVQPNAKVVPFFQLGGGGIYSDAAHDDSVQHLLGADCSFDLEAAAGVRLMASERFSITAKVDFRHFSNACLAHRNQGLNSLGGVLGVSWFY